jgi:lipopolysaccharide transport system ATP-binding protein
MSDVAVRVDDVWKRFHRGERQDSLRDLLPAFVRKLRANRTNLQLPNGDFWAVREASYQVKFGEALGIIGPNGAGKSTMLKLLTGILRPNKGEIRMRGRMASLIEVAAGFHQDLTGRENVFLQGAIMGMSKREVQQRLDSIIEFAGIDSFIDTPVKRYSSGMNARLGFAIAVHLDPDVLVIDEVLSVGDMAFQQRCVQRMKAFKRDGVAIVFVSHNMQAIGDLCDQALVLKSTPRFIGNVGEAISQYLQLSAGEQGEAGGDGVTFVGSRLVDSENEECTAIAPHTRLKLEVTLDFTQQLSQIVLGFVVRRATDAAVVYDGNFSLSDLGLTGVTAGSRLTVRFDHSAHLARGQYTYELGIYDQTEARHRLVVSPVAGLRVDEYQTYSGVANLEVSASGELLGPPI